MHNLLSARAEDARSLDEYAEKDPHRSTFDYFVARSADDKDRIYQLRYSAYHGQDLIAPRMDQRLRDGHDDAPGTFSLGVTDAGRLVSTIRLSVLHVARPASANYAAFADHLGPMLQGGTTITDISRLAVLCETTSARRRLIHYTLRLAEIFAAAWDTEYGAVAVRRSHVPFYRRYGFSIASEPRPYSAMVVPLSLMLIHRDRRRRDVAAMPAHLLASGEEERRMMAALSET
ncbi:MAG: hypothetical protein AAFN17_17245, partial [Pseudomonadota bacterium]